jgi:hypothetical protein
METQSSALEANNVHQLPENIQNLQRNLNQSFRAEHVGDTGLPHKQLSTNSQHEKMHKMKYMVQNRMEDKILIFILVNSCNCYVAHLRKLQLSIVTLTI